MDGRCELTRPGQPRTAPFVVGSTWTYTAAAVGTPAATFALVNPTAGASIDPSTGPFRFTPTLNQTGSVGFDVRVSNAFASADQAFT